jgi:NADH-quinone oxidoreductase subunit J
MIPFFLFIVCAALAVAGAITLIWSREPIHSALALILVMVALAVLYLLLGAPFITAVQIIVYAGAVMVLFVFVIMLLNFGAEERTNFSKLAIPGIVLALLLMAEIAHWLARSGVGRGLANGPSAPATEASTYKLSEMLFRQYLFPFEATSILILIAILGALVLARKESAE